MEQSQPDGALSPSERIDARIAELGDWRGELLARIRALIKDVDPDVVEEWKWRGTPVWEHDGMICTGETYKKVVKVTFARARSWTIRPASSTPASRATSDVRSTASETAELDEQAFKELVRAGIALNESKARR